MAIEIVSFPMNSMVIFHSYVNVYQRVAHGEVKCKTIINYPLSYLVGGLEFGSFSIFPKSWYDDPI
jgi:hypothetical protein